MLSAVGNTWFTETSVRGMQLGRYQTTILLKLLRGQKTFDQATSPENYKGCKMGEKRSYNEITKYARIEVVMLKQQIIHH